MKTWWKCSLGHLPNFIFKLQFPIMVEYVTVLSYLVLIPCKNITYSTHCPLMYNVFLWEEFSSLPTVRFSHVFCLGQCNVYTSSKQRLTYLYLFPPVFLLFNFAERTLCSSWTLHFSLSPRKKRHMEQSYEVGKKEIIILVS